MINDVSDSALSYTRFLLSSAMTFREKKEIRKSQSQIEIRSR